jgi:hypothetical protein
MGVEFNLWQYKVISMLNNQDDYETWDYWTDANISDLTFQSERIFGDGSSLIDHVANTNYGYIRKYFVPKIDISEYTHTFIWAKSSQYGTNTFQVQYVETPTTAILPVNFDVPLDHEDRWVSYVEPNTPDTADPTNIQEVWIGSDKNDIELYVSALILGRKVFTFGDASFGNPPPSSHSQSKNTNLVTNPVLGGSGGITEFISQGSKNIAISGYLFGDLDDPNPHDRQHLTQQLNQFVYDERPLILEWPTGFLPVTITDFPDIRESAGQPLDYEYSLSMREYNNDR